MKMMLAAMTLLCSTAAIAQMASAPAPDKLPPGYLTGKPPVDILTVLPPPPAPGSAQDFADRTVYAASANGIDDPIWARSRSQLNPTSPEFMAQLSCALGTKLSPAATPASYVLIARTGLDLAAPMSVAKNFYKRLRPFTTDKGKACDPIADDGIGEKLGYAYPSGHSGVGWLWALALADAAPGHADALRKFGMATGDLRIACRVHWLSDVAYGRVLATAVYDRIAVEPEYRADVARAAAELAKAPPLVCQP